MKKIVLFLIAVSFGVSVLAQDRKGGLYAKSVIGQKAPELVVEEWISDKPDIKGKFVMIDFWATKCNPCRALIPEMNEWNKHFKDDMVIIGISYETVEKVKSMKSPVIEYYNGVDTKKTMSKQLEVQAIPHVILIDPEGIVRWEGYPLWPPKLTTEVIENIIKEYKEEHTSSNTVGTQTRTMKFEIKSAEDLQNILKMVTGGNGNVNVKIDSSKGVAQKVVVKQTDAGVTKKIERQPWWGKSIINQKAPEIQVDKWVTGKPDRKGKFTLVHFWSTLCGPCLKSIPKLNEFHKMFKDDMIVMGISRDDSVEKMKGKPNIEYYRAVDAKGKTSAELDLHVLSYVLLIDPQGIVRLEDVSQNLTAERIREIIKKYK